MDHKALGSASQISIGTPDLAASIAYYEKFGFRLIGQSEQPYPWAQVTDGSKLLLLNQDEKGSYIGLLYMNPDMDERITGLREAGIEVPAPTEQEGMPSSVFFNDPSGFPIGIVAAEADSMYQPTEPSLKDFPQEEWDENLPMPNPAIGIFGELCFPVKDLQASIAFWKKLGFSIQEFGGPYPWAIATDERQIIGLHQTTEFEITAITYFAKDMGDRIKKLQESGVATTIFGGTGGDESNQIAQAPDGTHFFLFSY